MISCQTDTAVVILSYNGLELHKQFLPQIIEESKNLYDVVVVDNASTDNTFNYINEHHPDVHLIQHKVNIMFCLVQTLK